MTYLSLDLSHYFQRSHQALAARRPSDLARLDQLLEAPVTAAVIATLHELLKADQPAAPALAEPASADGDACGLRLRQLRRLVLMAMMERDARQQATVSEVVTATSALAELAISEALRAAALEASAAGQIPTDSQGRPMDLLVVGMGKLGGYELNVSSDIDLVFVTRDQGPTPQYANRIARRMINLLAEVTADGFVFRVDTRLRPHGDSGPLICSLNMLEQYFYEQGRQWERFAWLKARVIASSGLAGHDQVVQDEGALMQVITPFVYRRYLDYAALAELAGLHELINQEATRNQVRRLARDRDGFDVKLGRGGIREIEFSAQLHQIMRGGHDASLRERATPAALQRIASRGLADEDTTQALIAAWTLMRRTEHALQYIDDGQTHWLPGDAERRAPVAAFIGLPLERFDEQLRQARQRVAAVFDQLLAPARDAHDDEETLAEIAADTPHGAAGTEAALPSAAATGETTGAEAALPSSAATGETAGTEAALPSSAATGEASGPGSIAVDPEALRRIETLRESRRYRVASDDSRHRIERLLRRALYWGKDEGRPPLVEWIGRLCDLIETIAGRPAYLRLLSEHRRAYEQLLLALSQARWAATYLNQHPVVLDELLDGQLLEPFDCARWARHLRQQLEATRNEALIDAQGSHPPDVERQMDVLREEHHAAVFRTLAQDISGQLTVEAVGDQLSDLADAVLAIIITLSWQQVTRRHRETPRFAVIAYGKLGGLELGYASDLDLVFLYDDEHEDAQQNYSQLAQRIGQWLSVRTAAGQLFEIDLRLRPNGNAGLLVSSLGAFADYQRQSAWVWEHQALTRARYASGDNRIGSRFEQLRRELLAEPRDRRQLGDEIVAMRKRMHEGHPNRSQLFDLKHDAGGMVDIEFIVQYLVLAFGALFEDLLDNRGNIELLRRAASAGLIDHDDAHAVADAYRLYRRRQHALRLNDESYARVEPVSVAEPVARVRALWRSLFGDTGGAAQRRS